MFNWLSNLFHQDPLKVEANDYAHIITKQLTRMGMCYIKQTRDVDIFQEVRFINPLIFRPDRVELEVDVVRLPRGISLADLKQEKLIETISTACKRKITVRHDRRAGFWFIVERAEVQRGNFHYKELELPNQRTPLLIPVGKDDRGKQIWRSLAKMPHLLLAGATGGGKTTMIHTILCWLIEHNDPQDLELYIIDLKEGLDLIRYDGLPHLQHDIVYKRDEALAVLELVFAEIEKRGEEMREIHASDIFSYRYRTKKKIPFIVIVFDEIANLNLLPTQQRTRAWSLIKDSAQRARALGIHLVFATQRPSVDVIDGDIKANFTTRVAFRCASEVDSRVILNLGDAWNLPIGDLIYLDSRGTKRLRGVLTTEKDADRIVPQVIAKYKKQQIQKRAAQEKLGAARTELETRMLDYARKSLNGDFPIKTMCDRFGGETTQIEIEQIAQDMENRGVLLPSAGRRPRHVASCVLCQTESADVPTPTRKD